MGKLRDWARALKRETLALYFATRDPRTPWTAKLIAGCVVAYALSPIDLIPDFIPVLGYLDDLVLLPAGIWLALRFVPPEVLAEARRRAAEQSEQPVSRIGAVVIIVIWLACTLAAAAAAWMLL